MRSGCNLMLLVLGMAFLAVPALAGETEVTLNFSREDIRFSTFEGHDIVSLGDCTLDGRIGAPGMWPSKTRWPSASPTPISAAATST